MRRSLEAILPGRMVTLLHPVFGRGVIVAAMVMTAAACGGGPTSPSMSVRSLAVTCPSQLLIGQSRFCSATAELASGSNVYMRAGDINWVSSNATIASTGYAGLIKGQSGGPVRISGVYAGVSGSADVVVLHQDVLECSNTLSYQGTMQIGTTVTIWIQGFYGVESALSGRLSMQITDQDGEVIARNSPLMRCDQAVNAKAPGLPSSGAPGRERSRPVYFGSAVLM